MYKLMSPGPTKVAENVRLQRALDAPNPDLDLSFVELYKNTCDRIGAMLGAKDAVYILSGEAILGLEAACASLIEPGDRVLVISNGVYGKYFADFVKTYGGIAVTADFNWHCGVNPEELKKYLKNDHNFKYATLVHCDTPSGVLNDIDSLCKILKSYGILTIVDAVASSFAVPINVSESMVDILCCGSQKALSAPAGITILCVSEMALSAMKKRKTPIAGFYCNILNFERYYEDKWFPYTMPASDILGIRQAVKNIENDHNRAQRHLSIATAVRKALLKAGLSLYMHKDFSPTVTAILVPDGFTAEKILSQMLHLHSILIAGSVDVLKGDVIRIGHMGENANEKDVYETLAALGSVLKIKGNMGEYFMSEFVL